MSSKPCNRCGSPVHASDQCDQGPDAWLMSQCNRYVNGHCSTRACLVRGGVKTGQPFENYEPATCEAHEILQETKRLLADKARLDWLEAELDERDSLPGLRQAIDTLMEDEK